MSFKINFMTRETHKTLKNVRTFFLSFIHYTHIQKNCSSISRKPADIIKDK